MPLCRTMWSLKSVEGLTSARAAELNEARMATEKTAQLKTWSDRLGIMG
jgi:hypothetical protein